MTEANGMHYDSCEAYKAQKKYCKENGYPVFADKICSRCSHNIFGRYKAHDGSYLYGYSVESAEKTLLTRCPFCNYSFVE